MSLLVLLLLVLIAALFAWRNRRTLSRVCAVLAILVVILVGCGILPTMLLKYVQAPYVTAVNPHWGARNVIVLLGAGLGRVPTQPPTLETGLYAAPRLMQSAQLYFACQRQQVHCTVLVSGGDVQKWGMTEAAVYGAQLQKLGVPAQDLVLETRSLNTWQNAQFTSELLRKELPQQVILVSSAMHLPRSVLYFQHAGIKVTPVRAEYLSAWSSWLPLSYNFALTDLALHEYMGLLQYQLYTALGWNPPARAVWNSSV